MRKHGYRRGDVIVRPNPFSTNGFTRNDPSAGPLNEELESDMSEGNFDATMPWWKVFKAPALGTTTFDLSWCETALAYMAILGAPPSRSFSTNGDINNTKADWATFVETFAPTRITGEDWTSNDPDSDFSNKGRKGGSGRWIWPQGMVELIVKEDKEVQIAICTNEETVIKKVKEYCKEHVSHKPPPGRVHVIVSTQYGLEFESMGVGGMPLERGNYTEEVIDAYDKIIGDMRSESPTGRLSILNGPPGTGKCLGKGTPVLKANGSIVPVEDIKTGDLLMGPDSKPRRVLNTNVGFGPLYKILPTKGDSWVCNDVHVLTLKDTDSKEIRDVPLNEFLKESAWSQSRSKQFRVGVDFAFRETLIDPYFFGLWVGDGSKSVNENGELALVAISKPDVEVFNECQRVANKYGLAVKNSNKEDKCPTYRITKGEKGNSPNALLEHFRAVLPKDLSIPREYLINDRSVRLAFLAGILDSDGSINNGGFEIVQKRLDYAKDILFLARSLGFAANESKKVVNSEIYHRIFISGDLSCVPTKIPRKQAATRQQVKDVLTTGFKTESIGNGFYYGFTLDGDGRFLLGDFTVTHNTHLVKAIINDIDALCVIVPANLVGELSTPSVVPSLIDLRKRTEKNVPIVFLIEDADDCLVHRADTNMSVISSVLNLCDGIMGSLLDIRIIATTNADKMSLDKALTRPGRLSANVEIGPLSYEQSLEVIKRLSGPDATLPNSQKYTLAELYNFHKEGKTVATGITNKQQSVIGFGK